MDKINQYINNKYIKTNNNKDRIKIRDIFNGFKSNITEKEQKELTFKNFKKLLYDNPSFKFLIIKISILYLSNYKVKLTPYEEMIKTIKSNND